MKSYEETGFICFVTRLDHRMDDYHHEHEEIGWMDEFIHDDFDCLADRLAELKTTETKPDSFGRYVTYAFSDIFAISTRTRMEDAVWKTRPPYIEHAEKLAAIAAEKQRKIDQQNKDRADAAEKNERALFEQLKAKFGE